MHIFLSAREIHTVLPCGLLKRRNNYHSSSVCSVWHILTTISYYIWPTITVDVVQTLYGTQLTSHMIVQFTLFHARKVIIKSLHVFTNQYTLKYTHVWSTCEMIGTCMHINCRELRYIYMYIYSYIHIKRSGLYVCVCYVLVKDGVSCMNALYVDKCMQTRRDTHRHIQTYAAHGSKSRTHTH